MYLSSIIFQLKAVGGIIFQLKAVGCGQIALIGLVQVLLKLIMVFKDLIRICYINGICRWRPDIKIYTYPEVGAFFISAVYTDEDIEAIINATEEFVRAEMRREMV